MEQTNVKENQPPPTEPNTSRTIHSEERGGSDRGWLATRKLKRKSDSSNKGLEDRTNQKRDQLEKSSLKVGRKRKRSSTSMKRRPEIMPMSLAKTPRYCCPECEKWYEDDPCYNGKEEHLRATGRHRTERAKSPPGIWDISFPDSD